MYHGNTEAGNQVNAFKILQQGDAVNGKIESLLSVKTLGKYPPFPTTCPPLATFSERAEAILRSISYGYEENRENIAFFKKIASLRPVAFAPGIPILTNMESKWNVSALNTLLNTSPDKVPNPHGDIFIVLKENKYYMIPGLFDIHTGTQVPPVYTYGKTQQANPTIPSIYYSSIRFASGTSSPVKWNNVTPNVPTNELIKPRDEFVIWRLGFVKFDEEMLYPMVTTWNMLGGWDEELRLMRPSHCAPYVNQTLPIQLLPTALTNLPALTDTSRPPKNAEVVIASDVVPATYPEHYSPIAKKRKVLVMEFPCLKIHGKCRYKYQNLGFKKLIEILTGLTCEEDGEEWYSGSLPSLNGEESHAQALGQFYKQDKIGVETSIRHLFHAYTRYRPFTISPYIKILLEEQDIHGIVFLTFENPISGKKRKIEETATYTISTLGSYAGILHNSDETISLKVAVHGFTDMFLKQYPDDGMDIDPESSEVEFLDSVDSEESEDEINREYIRNLHRNLEVIVGSHPSDENQEEAERIRLLIKNEGGVPMF